MTALVTACDLIASTQLGTVQQRRRIPPTHPGDPAAGSLRAPARGAWAPPAPPGLPEEVFANSRPRRAHGVRASPRLAQEPACKTRRPTQVPRGCLPAAAAPTDSSSLGCAAAAPAAELQGSPHHLIPLAQRRLNLLPVPDLPNIHGDLSF